MSKIGLLILVLSVLIIGISLLVGILGYLGRSISNSHYRSGRWLQWLIIGVMFLPFAWLFIIWGGGY